MARSFIEIGEKAEELIEQGDETEQKINRCLARVASCSNTVNAARRQLAAVSKTDEEGNPVGDVAMAQAQLSMAENVLAASRQDLESARWEAERIMRQKNVHVHEIERHNRIEESNLEKLRRLRTMAFGENSVALTREIKERYNTAEDIKAKLLRSMGKSARPEHISDTGAAYTHTGWNTGGFAPLDLAGQPHSMQKTFTPTGGGLGNWISHVLHGNNQQNTAAAELPVAPVINQNRYIDVKEMSDELFECCDDYAVNSEKYNTPLRNHSTTAEIENFRKQINDNRISGGSVFFRRASLADLGPRLAHMPPEELKGRCYQFEGIMSVAEKEGFAGRVNDGNDATFEIHVPQEIQGLDLTQVDWFRQAMIDSPFCLIESAAFDPNSNSTHFVVRILSAGDALNRVNDFASLQKYMDSRHGIKFSKSLEYLNIDTMKSTLTGFESVISEYPEISEILKYAVPGAEGVASFFYQTLDFNPEYYSDADKLPETCRTESAKGGWVKNVSACSVGAHEAAHIVEELLILINPNCPPEKRQEEWCNCTEAKKIVSKALERVKQTPYGAGKSNADLINAISGYAIANMSEAMAEGFQDVYANGKNANSLSIEIKRCTAELMQEYKKGY